MIDPISIIVKADELQVEGISQYFITVMSDYEKFEIVKKLFSTLVVSQCIICVNSVNRVIDLYESYYNILIILYDLHKIILFILYVFFICIFYLVCIKYCKIMYIIQKNLVLN